VVTLAGLSGFYMIFRLDGWGWYQDADYWWVHAMTLLWLIFTFVLFVAESDDLREGVEAFYKKRAPAFCER